MGPVLHQSHILGGGVNTLTILYRPLEHVGELSFVAQEVWPDEVDHAPILYQIILQGISGQYHASFCTDLLQSLKDEMEDEKNVLFFCLFCFYLGNGCVRVLNSVTFVTYN